MTCTNCTPSTYRAVCVDCGVRLVRSARSKRDTKTARRLQDGHLAFIEHVAGHDVRKAVEDKLRGRA